MTELILRWLNGKRNYTVGRLLYQQFGSDEVKNKLFASGKTTVTEQSLLLALQKLLAGNEPAPAKEIISYIQPMPEIQDDQVLKALRAQWLPFYTEMNLKRHRLQLLVNEQGSAAQKKRAELAGDILNLEQKCMAVWAKRDHYEQYGTLPGKETEEKDVIVDPAAVKLQVTRLQSYIRSYKSKVNKNPGDDKSAAKLKQFTEELKQLNGGK